jgi:lactoylglutathione lyase
MHLGSIYLVVNDFEKSMEFYEKLLEIPATFSNMNRFAGFEFEGHCISILNAHFDANNQEKIVNKGEKTNASAKLLEIALAPNTHKFALNFWVEDLRTEYERIKRLNMTDNLGRIKYFCFVAPYYNFQLTDPDGNIIEVNGDYTPEEGEFDE